MTSWKKQSTACGAIDIGSMTSLGSITAVGDGSNPRIGASSLTRRGSLREASRAPAITSAMPAIDSARTVSSRNTAPSTSATTGIR